MKVEAGRVPKHRIGGTQRIVVSYGIGCRLTDDVSPGVAEDDVIPDRRVGGADVVAQPDPGGGGSVGVVGVDGVVVDAGVGGAIVHKDAAAVVPNQVVVGDVAIAAGKYGARAASGLSVVVQRVVADDVIARIDAVDGVVPVDLDGEGRVVIDIAARDQVVAGLNIDTMVGIGRSVGVDRDIDEFVVVG